MPYIADHDRRHALDEGDTPRDMAELTYAISSAIEKYLWDKPKKFQTYGEVQGAIRSAQREFERTVVDPYEESKKRENGRVVPLIKKG